MSHRFSLLLLIVLLVGSAEAQPFRIVVLGSSTAQGAGASHPDSAWVNRYRAHVQALDPANEVVNRARGGYTTYHLLPSGFADFVARPEADVERNVTYALALGPDAIIVNLPSNDVALGYSVAEQMANFETIVRVAGSVPVWITTTQPRNLSAPLRARLIETRDAILERFGDYALDFWTGLALPDGRIDPQYDSGDGVHVNDAGHRILFERVRAARILGLRRGP